MAKKQSGGGKRKANLPALIEQYYADLEALTYQRVFAEMGTRTAFHTLLHEEGKRHGWTLIAEHEKKVNGRLIRPDGTFKDQLNLVRGYWEAKDTDDKLDIEIEKKRKAGYPRLPRLRVGLPAASPRSILTAELLRNLRRSSEKEARRVSERIGRVEVAFPLVPIME